MTRVPPYAWCNRFATLNRHSVQLRIHHPYVALRALDNTGADSRAEEGVCCDGRPGRAERYHASLRLDLPGGLPNHSPHSGEVIPLVGLQIDLVVGNRFRMPNCGIKRPVRYDNVFARVLTYFSRQRKPS